MAEHSDPKAGLAAPKSIQRVRCGAHLHRIEWNEAGPRLLDADPAIACLCGRRVEEWRTLGIPLPDVQKWISAGFSNARMAKPWITMGAAPGDASDWRARGFNANQAREWAQYGVSSMDSVEWRKLGFEYWDLGRIRNAVRPHDFADWCAAHHLEVSAGHRLVSAAAGNLERAADLLPLLQRFPEFQSFDDPIDTLANTDYSEPRLEALLDRGLSSFDIWQLGSAHLPEEALEDWLSTGLNASDISRAVEAGWTVDSLRRALDALEAFEEADLPEAPRKYFLLMNPTRAKTLAATTPLELANREREFLERCDSAIADTDAARALLREYISAFLLADFLEWFDVGISASAAAVFTACKCSPTRALQWLQAGWTPSDACNEIGAAAGQSSVTNRKMRPWRKYFSRVARATDTFVVHRGVRSEVLQVTRALAVPHGVRVSMYSFRLEACAFLDGGFAMYDEEGFAPSSSCRVIGNLALRFLCSRLGLRPPRRLKEEATTLSAAQIEDEYLRQRREDWPTLQERFQTLIGTPPLPS